MQTHILVSSEVCRVENPSSSRFMLKTEGTPIPREKRVPNAIVKDLYMLGSYPVLRNSFTGLCAVVSQAFL